MKILSLHCDYIKFKAVKKALKNPEKLTKEGEKEKEIKEALVIFTAVEKSDTSSSGLVKEVKDIASQVKAKNIVLYPYAHLSSNLASPDIAVKIMTDAEKQLKKSFTVVRAPFGYYKEFELKCKGHPLSELSREITTGGGGGDVKEEKYNHKQLLKEISKSRLDREKLKENDHRILGQKMDLFSFHDTAPGMVFWHNNGLIIWNEVIKFWREEHRKAGYQEIRTPQILDKKLWQISGHWEKFRENMFTTQYENRDFSIKPMNCPGGILVYKSNPKSYKDLPLKTAELGIVHRQELSGVLAGLFRVIQFVQDDAHIYCTEDQIEQEVIEIINLTDKIYKKFKLKYRVELSTRPKKRIGSDKLWDISEKTLEKVLKKKKIKYKINKGDGAFYGPKIDFHIKDSLNREWQTGTIQLDMAMPERFNLEYTDKDNKKKQPIMLHRTVLGSLERFLGILLEHTSGNLSTWISPIQCRVISFTERNTKACKQFIKKIGKQIPELRLDADFTDRTVNQKVRDAELMHIPHIIVIGDKEQKSKTIAVRERGKKPKFKVKAETFIKNLKKEIIERK